MHGGNALEGITHSLCTLEFQDNRRLYDWVLDNVAIPVHPASLVLAPESGSTVMSKRKLNLLVTSRARWKAGMTRVCRPFPVCVVVAHCGFSREFCNA
ncbi:glutamate--tRNA ligase family protein [Shigella flexneri]